MVIKKTNQKCPKCGKPLLKLTDSKGVSWLGHQYSLGDFLVDNTLCDYSKKVCAKV